MIGVKMNYYEEFIAIVRGDLSEQIEEVSRSFAERVLPGLIEYCRELVKAVRSGLEDAKQQIIDAITEYGLAEILAEGIESIKTAVAMAVEHAGSRSWPRPPREIFPRGLRTVDKRQDIRLRLRCAQISRR